MCAITLPKWLCISRICIYFLKWGISFKCAVLEGRRRPVVLYWSLLVAADD